MLIFDRRPASHTTIALEGRVSSGLGEGTRFMALDWVQAQCRERLGLAPWPGTFNLAMSGPRWERYRSLLQAAPNDAAAAGPVIALSPPPGFCAANCVALRIAGTLDGYAIVPLLDDYPDDKLEIIAAQPIRCALGLADGDRVTLTMPSVFQIHDAPCALCRPLPREGDRP